MTKLDVMGPVMEAAKQVAIDYYRLTGKPLGITGEIGEYYAAKHLGLELAEARTPGFDAYGTNRRRIQIKSRSIQQSKKLTGQRLGSILLEHEWDVVILVLMDKNFEPFEMYEADRESIEEALRKPGSKARNERNALAVTNFISIGTKVWPKSR